MCVSVCILVHTCTHTMPCPSTVCSTQYVNSVNINTQANISKYAASAIFMVIMHPTKQCSRKKQKKLNMVTCLYCSMFSSTVYFAGTKMFLRLMVT